MPVICIPMRCVRRRRQGVSDGVGTEEVRGGETRLKQKEIEDWQRRRRVFFFSLCAASPSSSPRKKWRGKRDEMRNQSIHASRLSPSISRKVAERVLSRGTKEAKEAKEARWRNASAMKATTVSPSRGDDERRRDSGYMRLARFSLFAPSLPLMHPLSGSETSSVSPQMGAVIDRGSRGGLFRVCIFGKHIPRCRHGFSLSQRCYPPLASPQASFAHDPIDRARDVPLNALVSRVASQGQEEKARFSK